MLNLTGTKATTHKNLLIAARNTRKASPICRKELQKSRENQTVGSQMCMFENACERPFLAVPTFRTVRRRQFLRGPPAGVARLAGVPSVTGCSAGTAKAPHEQRCPRGAGGSPAGRAPWAQPARGRGGAAASPVSTRPPQAPRRRGGPGALLPSPKRQAASGAAGGLGGSPAAKPPPGDPGRVPPPPGVRGKLRVGSPGARPPPSPSLELLGARRSDPPPPPAPRPTRALKGRKHRAGRGQAGTSAAEPRPARARSRPQPPARPRFPARQRPGGAPTLSWDLETLPLRSRSSAVKACQMGLSSSSFRPPMARRRSALPPPASPRL